MKEQLYVKLSEDDKIYGTELIWMDTEEWKEVDKIHVGTHVGPSAAVIRPVSAERDTESTEDLDEVFRHGLHPVYEEAREVERLKLLREHYAGLAMQGIIASPTPWTADYEASTPMTSWKDVAEGSVQMADALIAALNKKEETV